MAITTPFNSNWQPGYGPGSGLRSPLDRDNLTSEWKKTNQVHQAVKNLAVQSKQQSDAINKLRRRILTPPIQPASQVATPFPFFIYNINNATDSTKNAQTFQIRDGLVGFRPQYVYPDTNINGMRQLTANGNYEMPLLATGTDGLSFENINPWEYANGQNGNIDFSTPVKQNIGGSVIFDGSVNPMLVYTNQPGTVNQSGVQIVIDPGSNAFFQVSFWVKIIESASGAYTELWASLANGAGVPNFAASFPNLDFTFSIGLITLDAGKYVISQCQYGHLLNRYLETPPRPSNDNSPGNPKFFRIPQIQRGNWTNQALSGKIFYPGDVVIDDTQSFAVAALGLCFKSYICIADGIFTSTTAPHGDLTNWQFYQVVANS